MYVCHREATATCFGFLLSRHQAVEDLQGYDIYSTASDIFHGLDTSRNT
jgi:hypothetical protein